MPSSGCLCLSLPAIRPPEELTLSPKLQLDGSLTMSSSGGSSLQTSPRSLLPSLLPGPADKLTPKGPGQVRECEIQVSRCITSGRSEQSSIAPCLLVLFCFKWPIFPLRSSQPPMFPAGQLLSLSIPTSFPPELWLSFTASPFPTVPSHHCKHQCLVSVFPHPYFLPSKSPFWPTSGTYCCLCTHSGTAGSRALGATPGFPQPYPLS